MPASVASAPIQRTTTKTPASRASTKKPASTTPKSPKPTTNGVHPSPYEIMASRIANRVAEMAENYTFVEREKPSPDAQQQQQPPTPTPTPTSPKQRKPPRKLEMRLPPSGQSPTNITFSAPFLDNTLAKLLSLQNRMLKVSNDIANSEDVAESVKQEQFTQSAELSRIIALICAEKARQGA